MPVIRNLPADPFDLVIQGEQLRAAAFFAPVSESIGTVPMLAGSADGTPRTWAFLVADDDEEDTGMMGDGVLGAMPLRSVEAGNLIAANACISTPCGALVNIQIGRKLFINDFVQDTTLWTVVGQTVTGSGAALGNCRVVVYETGRIAVTAVPPQRYYSAGNESPAQWESVSPVVAETVSDGSGNFSISVPMNTAYQLTGYLTGSPDRAGITKNTVVPTTASTLIYLRDPTAADGGGGGTRVYGILG